MQHTEECMARASTKTLLIPDPSICTEARGRGPAHSKRVRTSASLSIWNIFNTVAGGPGCTSPRVPLFLCSGWMASLCGLFQRQCRLYPLQLSSTAALPTEYHCCMQILTPTARFRVHLNLRLMSSESDEYGKISPHLNVNPGASRCEMGCP